MLHPYNKPPHAEADPVLDRSPILSLMSAMLDQAFHGLGLIEYYHWSPLARFLVAVAWSDGAAYVNVKNTCSVRSGPLNKASG